MIYTSYFARLKDLPANAVPISICGQAPDWYKGLQYKTLAPKKDFFMEWKENHDNDYYIKCFNQRVLNNLDPTTVVLDLMALAECQCDDGNIVLICYEKPEDFCHRHLVAKWLNENGWKCKEYNFKPNVLLDMVGME